MQRNHLPASPEYATLQPMNLKSGLSRLAIVIHCLGIVGAVFVSILFGSEGDLFSAALAAAFVYVPLAAISWVIYGFVKD